MSKNKIYNSHNNDTIIIVITITIIIIIIIIIIITIIIIMIKKMIMFKRHRLINLIISFLFPLFDRRRQHLVY